MTTLRRLFPPLCLLAVFLLAWQLGYEAIGLVALAPPLDTFRNALALLVDPTAAPHIAETFKAFGAAMVIAIAGGVMLGTALGAHRTTGEVAEPIVLSVASLPKITLYPVILLIFGLGISAKVAFGALHGILPITVFTMNAIRNINPIYLRSARAMSLSPAQTARHILFPAVLPQVFSGIRVGISLALLGTLIGELFASQRGLGFMLLGAIGRNDVHLIGALVLILTTFAIVLSSVLLAVERRLWRGAAR
jgi:NitT/TauT family transport system permease protein